MHSFLKNNIIEMNVIIIIIIVDLETILKPKIAISDKRKKVSNNEDFLNAVVNKLKEVNKIRADKNLIFQIFV
jgi:hypothetical protein